MDKVREEFEKRFLADWQPRDDMEKSFGLNAWKAAYALYTKETEPLKWRWEEDYLFVGNVAIAEVYQQGGLWKAAQTDGPPIAKGVSEETARASAEVFIADFLAKLRGEA